MFFFFADGVKKCQQIKMAEMSYNSDSDSSEWPVYHLTLLYYVQS